MEEQQAKCSNEINQPGSGGGSSGGEAKVSKTNLVYYEDIAKS
jgi:hypothetical protein